MTKPRISLVGTPAIDIRICLEDRSANVLSRNQFMKVAELDEAGNLIFRKGTYVSYRFPSGVQVMWGPFNAEGHHHYSPGRKYTVDMLYGRNAERALLTIDPDRYTTLTEAETGLGGGATNNVANFYDLVRDKGKFPTNVELIASTTRCRESRIPIDERLEPLMQRIGALIQIGVYRHPPINLCIEGLGPDGERTILKSCLETAEGFAVEQIVQELPELLGGTVLVNTTYDPVVAAYALISATDKRKRGLLALTESLCSDTQIDGKILSAIVDRFPDLTLDESEEIRSCSSIKDLVMKYVLPRGRCTVLVNESEIEHLTGISVGSNPKLSAVLAALQRVRKYQIHANDRVYLTLGPEGCFFVDEHNRLMYCGTISVGRRPMEKTGAGDCFAAVVLALESIGRRYEIPAERIAVCASSAAQIAVLEGRKYISWPNVRRLARLRRRLASLGDVRYTSVCSEVANKRIGDLSESDWASITREDFSEDCYDDCSPDTRSLYSEVLSSWRLQCA